MRVLGTVTNFGKILSLMINTPVKLIAKTTLTPLPSGIYSGSPYYDAVHFFKKFGFCIFSEIICHLTFCLAYLI